MFATSLTVNDLLFLLDGAWVTLQLTAWSILLGTLAGLLFGALHAGGLAMQRYWTCFAACRC